MINNFFCLFNGKICKKKKNMPHFTEKKNNKHLIKLFGNIAISWNIVQVT